MSLEFKKISGSTPYLLNSASTAEELTLALEDYMRTGAQIIFTHDGEDCILSSFEYKSGIESTVIAYFVTPKKKLLKVDTAAGFDLVITESEFTPETDTTLTQSGKPADAKTVGGALANKASKTYVDEAVANASGGGIIDVTELPTTNIDEKSIYRVVNASAELWIKEDGAVANYGEYLAQFGYQFTFIVCDELPQTFIPSTETNTIVYVVRSTGEMYFSQDGTTSGLLLETEAFAGSPFRGLINSTDEITSDGDYTLIIETTTYHACKNGVWTELVSKEYVDNTVANALIITSSTEGSTKKFKITVDDSGTITATEVT